MTRAQRRVALRNAGLLLVQRSGLVAAGVVFATVVPRLMGPAVYGRYALVLSLCTLFVNCSTLGFTEVIGRHVPDLSGRVNPAGVRRLFGNLLTLRLASGALAALALLAMTRVWLRELDPVAMSAAAMAVLVRALSHYLFSFFLGLNQAARWGAGDLLSRWLTLALVIPGFAVDGFRGACLGLFLAEMTTMALGLWWNRSYLSLSWLKLDRGYVAPYLRLGLVFFAGNLLSIVFQSSGEVLVRAVARDYVQVSYFGLANGVYLTAATAVQQLSVAFVAVLTTLRQQGDREAESQAVKRLVSWLVAGGMAVVFAVLLFGHELVPLVLGRPYAPVWANLIPMALLLLVIPLTSAAGVVIITHDKARVAVVGGAIRLVALWSLGAVLTLWWASFGACVAMLGASSLHTGYLGWRMRGVMGPALRAWAVTVGWGMLFLPLITLRSSWAANLALYVVFLAGYFGALLVTRVLTTAEIFATWAAMRRPVPARDAQLSER